VKTTFDGDTLTRVDVAYRPPAVTVAAVPQRTLMQSTTSSRKLARRLGFRRATSSFRAAPAVPYDVRFRCAQDAKHDLPFAVAGELFGHSWKLGSKIRTACDRPSGSGKTVFIRNLVVAARLLQIPVVCATRR